MPKAHRFPCVRIMDRSRTAFYLRHGVVLLATLTTVALGQTHAPVAQGKALLPDSLTVLMGADATRHGSLKESDMGPGKVGWMEPWHSSEDSLTWTVDVPVSADYEVSVIVQGSGRGCSIEVQIGKQKLTGACAETRWDRVRLDTIKLPAGAHSFTLRSVGQPPLNKFYSLEVVRPEVKNQLAARADRGAAPTDWMVQAKYGVMVHWTSQTKPERGKPLPYCEAVRNFDVEKFAGVLDEMGAGYLVFTTSHAGFYFPGPNKVIDEILPGRTCSRDLVKDLAYALAKRNIKLELYYHPGHDDMEWWRRTHFDDDKARFFDLWCRIIGQIGLQYGPAIAGYWFDDALFTYYPFDAPWEKMRASAKLGNPQRLISFNSWIFPKVSDFYEVFAGEYDFSEPMIAGFGFLPVGGTGKFIGGRQAGLQGQITTIINEDWGHFKMDTPIGRPKYSATTLIAKIRDAASRRNVPLLDVEIYQDGSISPETRATFKAVRAAIKPIQGR